jgi:hypothetical protein
VKSFASNIFDDQDALSVGIREYVESKIAESLHKHSLPALQSSSNAAMHVNTLLNTFGAQLGAGGGGSVRVKLRVSEGGMASTVEQETGARFGTGALLDMAFLNGNKRVGPILLDISSNTQALQLGICGIYILALHFAAFLSPFTLLVTLWRMTALLSGYAVFSHLCGWDSEEGADLLLAPAVCVWEVVSKELEKIVQRYTAWKVSVQARALREVLGEAEIAIDSR